MAPDVIKALSVKEIYIDKPIVIGDTIANASQTVTISNIGAAGIGVATISRWLPIVVSGVTYYIPMWT